MQLGKRADVGTIPAPGSLSQDFPHTTVQDPEHHVLESLDCHMPAFALRRYVCSLYLPRSLGKAPLVWISKGDSLSEGCHPRFLIRFGESLALATSPRFQLRGGCVSCYPLPCSATPSPVSSLFPRPLRILIEFQSAILNHQPRLVAKEVPCYTRVPSTSS